MPQRTATTKALTTSEGFPSQKLVVMPEEAIRKAERLELFQGLILTATGFFPKAEHHHVERQRPLPETILILCLAGRGWVQMDHGERKIIEPNSLVWIPAGKSHRYGADAERPWTIQWAHFRGRETEAYASLLHLRDGNFVLPLPEGAIEHLAFAEIYERLEQDYTIPNLLMASARLRLILSEIYQLQLRAPGGSVDGLDRSLHWMRQHFRERPDLTFLAQLAGLSVPHFTTLFRRRTGYSPVDYFLRLKVQSACQLLDTTSLRISEIGTAVGISDPFYFSRLFRRVMSRSPREYRAAAKG